LGARNPAILCDVRDNVARITLDRQEAASSIDLNLARELMHAVLQCGENPI
jgi:enoyl-CoA hydratase/carnithine racemase